MMLNLLITEDNIEYIKNISNAVLDNNDEIRLVKIASNVNETIEYIKKNKIDLMIIDFDKLKNNGEVIKKLINKDYNNEKIIIGLQDINLMYNTNKKYDVLDIINNENNKVEENIEITNNLKTIEDNNEKNVYEKLIYRELLRLKYNLKHNGTKYIMESILYVIDNKGYEALLENLEKNIYTVIANKYDKSVGNIKNNIVKATNNMYSECSIKYLMKYFKYECDKKPTPKMVIATIVNKILLENKKKKKEKFI